MSRVAFLYSVPVLVVASFLVYDGIRSTYYPLLQYKYYAHIRKPQDVIAAHGGRAVARHFAEVPTGVPITAKPARVGGSRGRVGYTVAPTSEWRKRQTR